MRVLDLYYGLLLKFGNLYESVNTLINVQAAELQMNWESGSLLIHYHTHQCIEGLLRQRRVTKVRYSEIQLIGSCLKYFISVSFLLLVLIS